jgi:cysteine synthase
VIYENVFGMVGNTPYIKVCGEIPAGTSIYIKLEGLNPTGSLKDRACLRLIQKAVAAGELKPGMTLLDASSGNFGCALAHYGRLLGYEACVVSSSRLTPEKRDFISYYGAQLHQTGDFTIEGNLFCRELVKENPGRFCFLDQLHNWANPQAHYETTGPEILSAFPQVAMVVGSLGSGGSLLGIGEYLKERRQEVIVISVQAKVGTRLPGTASLDEGDYITPFIEKGYSQKIFDHVFKVTEAEAVAASIQLRNQGIFCGLQTGGVVHAAQEMIRQLRIKGTTVVLSGDSGWKNVTKLLTINSTVQKAKSNMLVESASV